MTNRNKQSTTKSSKPKLWQAVYKGNIKTVKQLINDGADVNAVDKKTGTTPLYLAINLNRLKIARILLENKAKVNKADINGVSPLYKALEDKNLDAAQLLLEFNADVDQQDNDGISPSYRCAEINYVPGLKFLHSHNANFDIARKNGASPLYISSQNNYTDTVDFLVNTVKVELNTKTVHGISASYVAAYVGNEGVVNTLINAGAKEDYNLSDKYGFLHLLYQKCMLDAAQNFWSHATARTVFIGVKADLQKIRDTVEENCPGMPTDNASLFGDLAIIDSSDYHGDL